MPTREPGKESVWDYPRPPRWELSHRTVRVACDGEQIARSQRAYRVLETSHPPTWYIPFADVRADLLKPASGQSVCEWKGIASYWSLHTAKRSLERVGWSYQHPTPGFQAIAGAIAFYPSRVECFLDDERVTPQPGDFYGGWISSDIVGPFKGAAGTSGW